MSGILNVKGLHKRYGKKQVLEQLDLEVGLGRIVGLIGPNGAGKTTLLKCLLGLTSCQGDIRVLGMDPRRERARLMEQVCFIADTAILPRWARVAQLLDYTQAVHPRFSRATAESFLAKTDIDPKQKVAQLSKGMVTQLHLALVMAIDARLLVLDEPTLGLDILYRKAFYTSLLNDYFDDQRTILITTHQVEEIEALLTDLIFIDRGRFVLQSSMEQLPQHFIEVEARPDQAEALRALGPIAERNLLGSCIMIFENLDPDRLAGLGKLRTPRIADLFVAKMQREKMRGEKAREEKTQGEQQL